MKQKKVLTPRPKATMERITYALNNFRAFADRMDEKYEHERGKAYMTIHTGYFNELIKLAQRCEILFYKKKPKKTKKI